MKNLNTVSNVDKLVKDIIDAGEVDMFRGSVSSLKDMSKALKEQHKLIEDLTTAGDFSSLKKVLKEQKKDQEAQQQATMDLMKAREKLLTISKEQDKKSYDAQMAHIDGISSNIKRLAQQSNKLQFSVSKTGKEMQNSMDKYERTLREREERYEDLGKTGAMIEQKFSKRFESSVTAFTGGIGDLENFGATFASSLTTLGAYLMIKKGEAAEKAALGGEGSEAAASAAQMLGTLGKVAGTLAIVGMSVLALVKLFQFIEGSVIKANEEILKTASITDLVSAGMGSTNKNLELVRNTFRDADFATEMGMAYDETLALVGQFNQLNMGIKQFGGGKKGMERMKDAMKATKGMAFGLGISMEEAQGYMAKFTHDLGVSAKDGSIVARMAGDFADIRDMALQSSYSTANFFKKVTELTDQLENMNYRTREAGTLVLRFASVLGKSGLDKALQSLFSGFRGEGYLEQMKRNMLSKSSEVKKALKVEAIKFGKSFGESFGGGDGGLMGKLMKDQGASDQAGLIKKLANMDEKGRQDLFTRMKKEGGTEEFTDQLYKFIRLARGTKDKATGAEVQGAQEEMGAGGNLKTKFALIEARIGDKNMNDAGVVTKEMLTKFGVTKEQIELFGQLQTTMKGDMREAQRIAKKGGPLSTEDDAFLKKQGLDVQDGKLVMRETKMAVENFSDYLQTQDEAKFEDPDARTEAKTQEQYLDEGVAATTSVFNVLNNTIAGVLNDISGGIYNLVSHFSGLDEDEKKSLKEAQKILGGRIETTSGLKKDQEQKRMLLEKEVASYGFKGRLTGDQKKALEEKKDELKKVKAEEERLKEKESSQKRMLKDLTLNATNVDTGGWSDWQGEEGTANFLKSVADRESKSGKSKKMKAFKAEESSDLEGSGLGSYQELFTKLAWGGGTEDIARMMAEKGLTIQGSDPYDMSLMKGGEELVGAELELKEDGLGGTHFELEKRSKEQSITNELLKELITPEKKSVRQKEAKEAADATKEVNIATQVEAIKKSKDEEKKQELTDVRKALELKEGANAGQIASAYGRANDKQKQKLTNLSIGGNSVVQSLREVTPKPTEDILITNDGQVWKLDTADQMTSMSGGGYAMSKPGGAIDEYIGTRMSGGGGGGGITINVNGTMNPDEVGRVVLRHIKDYQKTTMGGIK